MFNTVMYNHKEMEQPFELSRKQVHDKIIE